MQYSGYTSTICNRAFVAGRSKLVETFMVDVFTATDETHQNFNVVLEENFSEMTQTASIRRDANAWTRLPLLHHVSLIH